MDKLTFTIPETVAGMRVDQWLSEQMEGTTRSGVQKLCTDGMVCTGDKPLAKNYRLRGGEELTVCCPDPVPLDVIPQNIPITIVYEDDDLLVVDKPKGMVVHPAPGNYDKTLVNALLYHCEGRLSSINGVIRPGIVHRIDKDTSGLLMVAKNDFAHTRLAEQIKAHTFTRLYQAVVYGRMAQPEGTICAPIGRNPSDRMKMCVTAIGSREATTHYRVLREYDGFSHLELRLETGRTHQIRVHLAHIGHPVAGDAVYGSKKVIGRLAGQCLHACRIGFVHPRSEAYLEFDSELPLYFSKFLKSLQKGNGGYDEDEAF